MKTLQQRIKEARTDLKVAVEMLGGYVKRADGYRHVKSARARLNRALEAQPVQVRGMGEFHRLNGILPDDARPKEWAFQLGTAPGVLLTPGRMSFRRAVAYAGRFARRSGYASVTVRP